MFVWTDGFTAHSHLAYNIMNSGLRKLIANQKHTTDYTGNSSSMNSKGYLAMKWRIIHVICN
jgi:hypothetical protein